jgi:hypothetical protein
MANTNKTRMRLEQIKGGKLEAKANDASAVQLVAQVSGSDENYLKMDTRTGAELLELGEASNVGIKLEGALSGASFKDQDTMSDNSATAVASQ